MRNLPLVSKLKQASVRICLSIQCNDMRIRGVPKVSAMKHVRGVGLMGF